MISKIPLHRGLNSSPSPKFARTCAQVSNIKHQESRIQHQASRIQHLSCRLPIPPLLPILPLHPFSFPCQFVQIREIRGHFSNSIMQNKPNFKIAPKAPNSYPTRSYPSFPPRPAGKNKPNQTQFQPKTRVLLDPEQGLSRAWSRDRRPNQSQSRRACQLAAQASVSGAKHLWRRMGHFKYDMAAPTLDRPEITVPIRSTATE